MVEIWKDVSGYEGIYQVSDFGNVKSLDRVSYKGRKLKGKPLKLYVRGKGYKMIGLYKDGRVVNSHVHRVVAQAFIPNPDNLPCVLHGDDDPRNNRKSNLRWGTYKDNMDDMVISGRYPNSKLSHEDVSRILSLIEEGVRGNKIAALLNVHPSSISRIRKGRTWVTRP